VKSFVWTKWKVALHHHAMKVALTQAESTFSREGRTKLRAGFSYLLNSQITEEKSSHHRHLTWQDSVSLYCHGRQNEDETEDRYDMKYRIHPGVNNLLYLAAMDIGMSEEVCHM